MEWLSWWFIPQPPLLFPSESNKSFIETYYNPSVATGSLAGRETGLVIPELDVSVQQYFEGGLPSSTLKTYRSSLSKFCAKFGVSNPFPISQRLSCYYVAYLADNGLVYQTIKTYLAAIRHIQIAQGLPEPKQYASMPKLKVVEKGVCKIRALDKSFRPRLPIIPAMLHQIRALWSPKSWDFTHIILWAMACTCFFD